MKTSQKWAGKWTDTLKGERYHGFKVWYWHICGNIFLTEQCIAIWLNTWWNRSVLCSFELFWFIQMQAVSRPILEKQKKVFSCDWSLIGFSLLKNVAHKYPHKTQKLKQKKLQLPHCIYELKYQLAQNTSFTIMFYPCNLLRKKG